MSTLLDRAEIYRQRAAEFNAMAEREPDLAKRLALQRTALEWLELSIVAAENLARLRS